MRVIFAAVLLVGLGLAGFAVYMAQNYIDAYQSALAKERAAHKPAIETVEVLVAAKALRYGEILDPEDVKAVQWPKNALPANVYTSAAELFPENDSRKRYVLRAMEPHEAMLLVKVSNLGEDAGLRSRLARGQRAFTINVNVATGVSGFLRPGDHVDVYWTGSAGSDIVGSSEFTQLIESRVQLIAIDQSVDQDQAKASIARTVTVAVNPQKVAKLAQAQSTGRLSLSLVGVEDDTVAQAIEVDQNSLLGLTKTTAKRAIKKEICTIRTRRGSDVVEIPIPCTN